MKRLLIASYISPPQLNSESILLLKKIRALDQLGWEMTLLTIDPKATTEPMDPKLATMIPESVRVILTVKTMRSIFGVRGVSGAFYRALVFLGLPEKHFPWFFPAIKAGRDLLRREPFDAIHSHASFHISNVVGLALKNASGLPWVAHFSDPWLDNPYVQPYPWQKKICSWFEEAVIRGADAVIFTTSQTADIVMSRYPSAWRTKAYVIPHGYETDTYQNVALKPQSHKRLRLAYSGNFVAGKRTPEGLLQALHRLAQVRPLSEEIEVELFGRHVRPYQSLVSNLGLDSVVYCRDVVPFEECLKKLAGADVLLLIDAPSQSVSQFLPSKLVDYLPFKKPILGLTPVEGASADLLRRLECPIVHPDDVPGIVAALTDLLQLWHSGQLTPSPQFDRVVPEYDNMSSNLLLDDILKKLIH